MRLADGPLHAALTANSRLGQPVKVTTVESKPPAHSVVDTAGHFIVDPVDIF